ncbi:MAG: hypothetical protein M1815_003286 [Lichina confinis]|nr:MAG: hypothetical protein M1815_003286 [Lichina confinis]
MVQNKAVIFKKVPEGLPVEGEHLVVEATDFDTDQAPPPGGITVKIHVFSLDPYQRGRLRDASIKSYAPPYLKDKPISNTAIAKVLKSDATKFGAGDVVIGFFPAAEYGAIPSEAVEGLKPLQNPLNLDPKLFLGPLGMPGLTAYSSFYEIGKPKKGETILVSSASGAVGQIVGQLAKHEGLKVIGSVGDDAKLDFIKNELAFDEGFNYKKESPESALQRLAPDGINIYYENVGGEHLDAALASLNTYGRVVACGMISEYNRKPEDRYGVTNLLNVISKRLTIRGFVVTDPGMGPDWTEEHQKNMQQWIRDGTFKTKLHVNKGIDSVISGLLDIFHGRNFGKAVVEIAELD